MATQGDRCFFEAGLPVDSYTAYGATIKYSKLAAERGGNEKNKRDINPFPSTRRVKKWKTPLKVMSLS